MPRQATSRHDRRADAAGGPGGPGQGPAGAGPVLPPRRRRLRDRRWVRITLALLVAFCLWVSWSVGHALTVPGGGTMSERLAEWARDHYLGPVVTLGEYLTYKPPRVGASRRSR